MKPLFVAFFVSLGLLSCPRAYTQPLQPLPDSSASLPDPSRYDRGIYTTMSVGPSILGVETGYRNIHRLLESQGLKPDPLRSMLYIGVGGRLHRLYAEMYVASTLASLSGFSYTSDKPIRVHADFASVGVNLGYALFQGRNESLILRLGADVAEYFLLFSESATSGPLDLTQVGGSAAGRSWPLISHFGPTGHLCLEFLGGRAKRPVTLASNLRLGYQFGLGQSRWKAQEGTLINAPTDRAGFLYIGAGFWIGRNFERKQKP